MKDEGLTHEEKVELHLQCARDEIKALHNTVLGLAVIFLITVFLMQLQNKDNFIEVQKITKK